MEQKLAVDASRLISNANASLDIPTGEKLSETLAAVSKAKSVAYRVRERYASALMLEVQRNEVVLESTVTRLKKIAKDNKRITDTLLAGEKRVDTERDTCMAQWNRLNEELAASKKSKLEKVQSKTFTLFKKLEERVVNLNATEVEHRQHRKDLCGILVEVYERQRAIVTAARMEYGDSIAAFSSSLAQVSTPLRRKLPSQKKLIDRYVSSLRVHNSELPCAWSDVRQHRSVRDKHVVPKHVAPVDELSPKERRDRKRESGGELSEASDSEAELESDAQFVAGLRSNWGGDTSGPAILSSPPEERKTNEPSKASERNAVSPRSPRSPRSARSGSNVTEATIADDVTESASQISGSARSSIASSQRSTQKRHKHHKKRHPSDEGVVSPSDSKSNDVHTDVDPAMAGLSLNHSMDSDAGLSRASTGRRHKKRISKSTASTPQHTLTATHKSKHKHRSSAELDLNIDHIEGRPPSPYWARSKRRQRPNGNPFRPGFVGAASHGTSQRSSLELPAPISIAGTEKGRPEAPHEEDEEGADSGVESPPLVHTPSRRSKASTARSPAATSTPKKDPTAGEPPKPVQEPDSELDGASDNSTPDDAFDNFGAKFDSDKDDAAFAAFDKDDDWAKF